MILYKEFFYDSNLLAEVPLSLGDCLRACEFLANNDYGRAVDIGLPYPKLWTGRCRFAYYGNGRCHLTNGCVKEGNVDDPMVCFGSRNITNYAEKM